MLAPTVAVDIDEPPTPLPWRGVRRLLIIFVAVGVMCVVVWIIWWRMASARYDREIAGARARGEPLTLADFPRPALADADNAAMYWKRSLAALVPVDCPANSNFTFGNAPPYPTQWFDLESAAVVANGPAIQLAMEAASHRQVDWGPPPPVPFFRVMLPYLNQFRELANQVGDAALDSHFKRNDAEAIRRVETLLDLSDDISNPSDSLVEYLVAIGIRALGLYRLQIIAGNLQFADDAPNGVKAGGVASLIDRLIDPSVRSRQLDRAMLAERADALGDLTWAEGQQPILRPLFRLESVQRIEESKMWRTVVMAANQPSANAAFIAGFTHPIGRRPFKPFFNGSFRFFETSWRVEIEQRMVAVELALHLYEHDHGTWPATLAQLVPKYIKRLPADPYAADGRPIGYVVVTAPNSHVARPMLYCDVDPGKPPTPLPPLPSLGWQGNVSREWRDVAAWQIRDAERHLKLPSTTQP